MASSLAEGEIPACLTVSSDYDACAYCDYQAVCGYEPGNPVREIARLDRAEVLEMLREEEENG